MAPKKKKPKPRKTPPPRRKQQSRVSAALYASFSADMQHSRSRARGMYDARGRPLILKDITSPKDREKHKMIDPMVRMAVVQAYLSLLTGRSKRIAKGGWAKITKAFNVSQGRGLEIVAQWRKANKKDFCIAPIARRHGNRGRTPANDLLSDFRLQFIRKVNEDTKRKLTVRQLAESCRKAAKKLRPKSRDSKRRRHEIEILRKDKWNIATLWNHLGRMGERWHRAYIKPKLTYRHKMQRIDWALQDLVVDAEGDWVKDADGNYHFDDLKNFAHLDEASFACADCCCRSRSPC